VAGAVLAAGSGTRMGGPKAELVLDGVRLLDRAVRLLGAAGCDPVLAVVRPGVAAADARLVVNEQPERGMRSSLELAVAAAAGYGADALAVLLVDTPGVTAGAVRAVVTAWRPERIAVARYADRSGHPIVMALPLWRTALARSGADEGARALLAGRPELVDQVSVAGLPDDLDTPADLAAWQRRRLS
jgi:molybdenum cofactor cytidylyltransferase/nicotine blue oxidoreductase